MRALLQRVSTASVTIHSQNYEESIGKGVVVLLGIKTDDVEEDAIYLANKCANLRIFEDANDKMNLSLKEIDGEALVVSQFTLYGETQKGNRPSFIEAARPETAVPLYELFISQLKMNIGDIKVKTGIFGAMMQIKIINEGPVTVIVESK